MKWIGQNIYDLVAKFRNTVDFSEDVTFYQPVNNADPSISIGASVDERFMLKVAYQGTGTQSAQLAQFVTYTESGTANDGRFQFWPDQVKVLSIDDGGIDFEAGFGISINGTDILTDNGSGAAQLNNIDALDATTIATLNDALTAGDITSVVAGAGMTGGGTTGDVTLNVIAGTGIDVAADAISVDVSDFMTNGSNNRVLTATGADAMNAEANLTFSGTQLSAAIGSSPGFNIDHTSPSNSSYGLKLNQSAPGLGIAVDHDETRTAGIGGRGFMVDYDKTAVLADGETGTYNGTNVSLYDQVTNHSGSTFTQTGNLTNIVSVGSAGAMTNIGYDASVYNLAGGGTNIGFRSNSLSTGGIDFYSQGAIALYATNSASDYFKIVTAVNGATTLTTVDAAGAAAHFEIEADGDITLDSAGQIKLEPVAGNNILLDGTIAIDAGVVTGATSITSTSFVGALTGQADTVATIAGLAPNTATTQASQPNITGVGTIGTGVWNGDAIASAYLDADTAHLSGAQTFTGTKTLNSFKGTGGATVTNILDEDAMGSDSATALATQQSIKAYVDTRLHYIHTAYKAHTGMDTERYVSLVDADREATSEDNVAVVAIIPATGVLKRVIINSSSDLSGKEWTYKLKRIPSGTVYASEILVATVVKDAGGAASTNSIVDFVTDDGTTNDLDFESGYSTSTQITAGDRVLFSVQANSAPSGQPKMNLTFVFEIDDATVL